MTLFFSPTQKKAKEAIAHLRRPLQHLQQHRPQQTRHQQQVVQQQPQRKQQHQEEERQPIIQGENQLATPR